MMLRPGFVQPALVTAGVLDLTGHKVKVEDEPQVDQEQTVPEPGH